MKKKKKTEEIFSCQCYVLRTLLVNLQMVHLRVVQRIVYGIVSIEETR